MKVRIGIGTSGKGLTAVELEQLCVALGEQGFDSIWLSEVLTQGGIDPFVGLAWLAGRLPKLKIGTTFLIPGRNVLRLARQLAALDFVSGGRLLLVGVPGLPQGAEAAAIGVDRKDRGRVMDDTLPLLKALLAGEATDLPETDGAASQVVVDPLPIQQPLELWLGGTVKSALVRCGRFGDGWLPSLSTPADVAKDRQIIEEVAASSQRQIDPEHYGVSIGYSQEPLPVPLRTALQARARRDDLTELVPESLSQVRDLLQRYVEVGFSKFVLRPLQSVVSWDKELELLAHGVGDLQT